MKYKCSHCRGTFKVFRARLYRAEKFFCPHCEYILKNRKGKPEAKLIPIFKGPTNA